jgi:ankyrin repeat protein
MARVRFSLAWIFVILGASLHATAQTPAPSSDKADALSAAARRGDAEAVGKLLDEGVDVNTRFRYNATALSYAADHGHLEVVKVLLAHKADVNVEDTFYGTTPLSRASSPAQKRKPEHAQIVGLLLRAGAQGKEDALAAAVSEPDLPMVRVVLDVGGLAPDALSDALEAATLAKNPDLIALLEKAGAKPHPVLKLDTSQLARYAGTYRAPNGNEVVVVVSAGQLTVDASRFGGPPKAVMVARDETTFVVPSAGLRVIFRADNGKVTAFTLGTTTYMRTGGV